MKLKPKEYYEALYDFNKRRKKHLREVAMTKIKFERRLDFKNKLVRFFERDKKSGWGKNQIVNAIKDIWIEHLETLMEDRKEE